VRCLLTDFSEAFDVVRHIVFFAKLSVLAIAPSVLNWTIAFLTDCDVQLCTSSSAVAERPRDASCLSS